jgi:WD40 repeat protein
MNTQKPLYTVVQLKEPKLLNVSFNQDQSCFAVCSDKGFQVYSTYPMELKMERDFTSPKHTKNKLNDYAVDDDEPMNTSGGIGMVKMLYKTNYIALVGGGKKPRFPLNKLCIWDDLKEKNSIILEFKTPILNVFLSRTHIVVILKNMILVYLFKLKPELLFSFETFDNNYGVSDLAISENLSILVFPGRAVGQLHIVDITNNKGDRKAVSLIKAHKNPVKFTCLSPSGNMIASASELGTIIRIHDTKSCSLLYEFRRGVDSALITDMKFSPNGSKLAILSDKCTIHIYHVYGNDNQEENKTHILKDFPLFTNYFKSTWSFVSKDVGNKSDLINDNGTIGWFGENSIVIIWKYKGIWEKYDIITDNVIRNGVNKGKHWKIIKEGWRSL